MTGLPSRYRVTAPPALSIRECGIRLPGCVHSGPCNNGARYARQWWRYTLDALRNPQQAALALQFAA